jgi:ribonuclease P protein component
MRLARGADLRACWDQGRRLHTPHLDIAWRPNRTGHPRLGIVVPRFQFTAVARNRLRRRLREILRRGALATLGPVDLVVRANRAAYAASFAGLRAELSDGVSRVT